MANRLEAHEMASQPIYQFYAVLDDYKPIIWRRFQVPGNVTIARLAYIVMTLFEMKASHLFAVEVPFSDNFLEEIRRKSPNDSDVAAAEKALAGVHSVWRYELLDFESDSFGDPKENRVFDATKSNIAKTIQHPGDKLSLNYDFGDDWWVSLTLESVTKNAALPGSELPHALEGAGFGIIEDCGGTPGLAELAAVFTKKKGTLYENLRDWLGMDELDMTTAFDIDDMNFRLKKLPRIYKQIYEDRLEPTQRSIALIERKYAQQTKNRRKS
ncbi:conserved hypothetical protein [uncultured delta proteobacterium]|uniref:Plasmid pRiA4b Orf3-like domain-containing protein n=1 Tax=uncultured delta proteobacterium TaxID=34034 RepID=A0A212IXD9_9DELT|nr:conserved hypothetical protein [uncultured delta proteobacterium]